MRRSEGPQRSPVPRETILRLEGEETLLTSNGAEKWYEIIVPMDMIWKSAKLFWIIKGCHHQ
jgi:hypothetical protein